MFLFLGTASSAQNLQVIGTQLQDSLGNEVILRGVNYPIINQGEISLANVAGYKSYIDQVALTGANSIRIPWYTDGQNWRDKPAEGGTPGTVDGYVQNGHLSNIIAYCIEKNMIPILSIHDDEFITCKDNWAYFNSTVMNFWTDPEVLNLIETNKNYLIINLANEFDKVRWGVGSVSSELITFKANYSAAISTLRTAGIKVPIMIDAPDCGQSSTELLTVAPEMLLNDPEHNLIFSAHAYWIGYANSLAQVQTKLNEAQTANVCFMFGEIAPNQDGDMGQCGFYDLTSLYPQILTEACSRNIGWLAWTFSLDCSSGREMSPNSNVNNLTTFGNDIVNNPDYGLKSTNGCGAELVYSSLGTNEDFINETIKIFPNPMTHSFSFEMESETAVIKVFSLLGVLVFESTVSKNEEIDVSKLFKGTYILEIEAKNKKQIKSIVIQ